MYKINWKYTSPHHPTSTGGVERLNQTLIGKLRKITDFGDSDWEDKLEKAVYGYLISYSRSINVPLRVAFWGKTEIRGR